MLYQKSVRIRKGKPKDIKSIYHLVEQQAEHHQVAPEEVKNTAEQMLSDAFGPNSCFRFLVAEYEGQVVGTAIYYFTYSTWKGKSLYLEDLIVKKGRRGLGIGKKLFEALVTESDKLGASKLTWQVAEDNEGAIRFYERFDAGFDEEWIYCTLNRKKIKAIRQRNQEREMVSA